MKSLAAIVPVIAYAVMAISIRPRLGDWRTALLVAAVTLEKQEAHGQTPPRRGKLHAGNGRRGAGPLPGGGAAPFRYTRPLSALATAAWPRSLLPRL